MIVTISYEKKEYDIMTNPDNSIAQTMKILQEKGMIPASDGEPAQIYSVRKKRTVPANVTYRESGIYQGDILRIK